MDNELLAVACTPGLSHGSFRLYAILAGIERQRHARDNYFPVTLNGLQAVHPGISGKVSGYTTIIKQIAELRQAKLLELTTAMPRNEPDLPVLLRLHHVNPKEYTWRTTEGEQLKAANVRKVVSPF